MATNLFFSRDTKVYVELFNGAGASTGVFEIPVLDGFSFSQTQNSTEVTLAEMESSAGVSKRGRRVFNDSLAPVEWSFSTYVRPFESAGEDVAGNANKRTGTNGHTQHAVEEALWAMFVGAADYVATTTSADATLTGITSDSTDMDIDFSNSNKSLLGVGNIYFSLSDADANPKVYKCTDAVVNEASLDFDIDGIATINWSGFASTLVEASKPTRTVFEGINATNNYIRNRLTQLTIDSADPVTFPGNQTSVTGITKGSTTSFAAAGHGLSAGDSIAFIGNTGITDSGAEAFGSKTFTVLAATDANNFTVNVNSSGFANSYGGSGTSVGDGVYELTLTGGSVTMTNNITYLTPETIGSVNTPIGHVSGARSISGGFQCYLAFDTTDNDGTSTDFFNDMTSATAKTKVVNSFATTFKVGGSSATPRLELNFPTAHFEIPAHSIEDVISLETTFQALPSTIDSTNEAAIKYVGLTPDV
tara:strand:- start:743 stop:2170 length:1428 start_codon:yes stop_codon:yes gene_type:complete